MKGLMQRIGNFIQDGGLPGLGYTFTNRRNLHARQGQRLPDMIVQVGCDAASLIFLCNRQLRRERLQALLIPLKLMFLLLALGDVFHNPGHPDQSAV